MRDCEAFFLMVIFAICGCVGGCITGMDWSTAYMQRAAVENHAAEWVVKPETGETTFRWKDLP